MPQTVSGFTVPAGSDAVSTIDDTMATMAGQVATRFSTFTTNAQTGTSYALALADAGALVTLSNASAVTVNIPLEASVSWAANTVVTLANLGAGTVTVTCTSGTLSGSSFTLAQNDVATVIKVGTNTWLMAKGGGGLPKATISATTGSPATGANGTKTWYRWITTGTVTIGVAGLVDYLVVGAGGSGSGPNSGGGGGGGGYFTGTTYLAAGTYTMTIGAGGASSGGGPGNAGGYSQANFPLAQITAYGGGGGQQQTTMVGSGGGGGNGTGPGLAIVGQNGNNGGSASGSTGGSGAGGGGAGAVGQSVSGSTGGSGGNGLQSSITGTATYYSGGGKGISGAATGLGSHPSLGGGTDANNSASTAGASGAIILLIG